MTRGDNGGAAGQIRSQEFVPSSQFYLDPAAGASAAVPALRVPIGGKVVLADEAALRGKGWPYTGLGCSLEAALREGWPYTGLGCSLQG